VLQVGGCGGGISMEASMLLQVGGMMLLQVGGISMEASMCCRLYGCGGLIFVKASTWCRMLQGYIWFICWNTRTQDP